jgi:hypothetical protein
MTATEREMIQTIEVMGASCIILEGKDRDDFKALLSIKSELEDECFQQPKKVVQEPLSIGLKKEMENALKHADPKGVVTFYCNICKKGVRYMEREFPGKDWLDCTCRCFCDCHSTQRWNKHDCTCKPCYICKKGAPGMPLHGPLASCGKQRMCHFGTKCRKKDTSCGFLHPQPSDD